MTKETAICKIHKENNIVHLEFNDLATLRHSDLNEIYEYINEVYRKVDLPKLIDIRAELVIDEKAKQFIKDQNLSSKISNHVILAGKNTNEDILQIFIGMNGEQTPFRVFTDYESAVTWLHSLGSQN